MEDLIEDDKSSGNKAYLKIGNSLFYQSTAKESEMSRNHFHLDIGNSFAYKPTAKKRIVMFSYHKVLT